MDRARASDNWAYLRSLLTIRDNAYLLLMGRKEQRSRGLPLRLGSWVALLTLVTVGGLALGQWQEDVLSRAAIGLSPGELAAALLITVEFYSIWYATDRRRYGLHLAEQENAAEHYRLIPLTWLERAGMRNTYPLFTGLAMMALALPLHLLCVRLGGWDDWWHLAVSHLFGVLLCVASIDRPRTSYGRRSRPAEEVDISSIRKRRRAGYAIALSNLLVQALSHAGRGGMSQAFVLWILLAPYLVPQALAVPRGFYGLQVPIAAPILLALVPWVVLTAKRMGRALDDRPITLRVVPWSLAGLGTVYGLVMAAGFCWHWIADGSVAALLPPLASAPGVPVSSAMVARSAADPARAADGLFVALLVAWSAIVAGPHLLRSGAVTWGPLRSHHSFISPLKGRQAWLMELGWTLEAGLSVYVPLLAYGVARWLGGLSSRLTPSVALQAVAVSIAVAMGSWVIGRGLRWLYAKGWSRAQALLWFGLVAMIPLGILAPAPLGPLFLSIMPVTAGLALVPGLAGFAGPLTGRFVPPAPDQAAAIQLLVAILGTVVLVYLWRSHPAARRTQAPAQAPSDTASLFERGRALERLTSNPVALRILRGRHVAEDPYRMLIAFGLGSALMYLTWLTCRAMHSTGAATGLFVAMLSDNPWMLASLPTAAALTMSLIAAGSSTATPLRMERATGALTHTCLTPLRPGELMAGYVIPPLLGTLGRLVGAGWSLPLLFVGTDPALILRILAIVSGSFVLLFAIILITGLLSGLPGAKGYGREGFWEGVVWALPVTSIWLSLGPLAILLAVAIVRGGTPALIGGAVVGVVAYLGLIVWAAWSARRRFGLLIAGSVPQGPETELLAELST